MGIQGNKRVEKRAPRVKINISTIYHKNFCIDRTTQLIDTRFQFILSVRRR